MLALDVAIGPEMEKVAKSCFFEKAASLKAAIFRHLTATTIYIYSRKMDKKLQESENAVYTPH